MSKINKELLNFSPKEINLIKTIAKGRGFSIEVALKDAAILSVVDYRRRDIANKLREADLPKQEGVESNEEEKEEEKEELETQRKQAEYKLEMKKRFHSTPQKPKRISKFQYE